MTDCHPANQAMRRFSSRLSKLPLSILPRLILRPFISKTSFKKWEYGAISRAAFSPSPSTAASPRFPLVSRGHSTSSNAPFPPSDATVPPHLIGLSQEQLAAVKAPLGAVRVVAGPGSGKTRVLTARIAHLLAEQNAKTWQILAITFTNKAANEIKERLASILDPAAFDATEIFAGTFHSLCYRILRRSLRVLPGAGRTEEWILYDQDASIAVMKKLVKAKHPDLKAAEAKSMARRWQGRISRVKNGSLTCHGMSADEAVHAYYRSTYGETLTAGQHDSAKELAGWFHDYEEALRAANALDFDDLLGMTIATLRYDTELLSKLQRRYKHVLIDEFQDTNTPQYELVRLLTRASNLPAATLQDSHPSQQQQQQQQQQHDVFVVGDPDQAIYGWRGAEVTHMKTAFARDFPDSCNHRLRDNYRSTAPILYAAQAVISRVEDTERSELIARRGHGPAIEVRRLLDGYDEAQHVATEVQALLSAQACRDKDIAVLLRTHAQARLIEQEFIKRGISYVLVGGVAFWRRVEVQDVMAYLRLAVTLDDDVALERVINVPKRGLGDVSVSKLKASAEAQSTTLSQFLFGRRTEERRPPVPSNELTSTLSSSFVQGHETPYQQGTTTMTTIALPDLPSRKDLGLSAKASASVESFRQIIVASRAVLLSQTLQEALRSIVALADYTDHVSNGGCGSAGGKEGNEEERLQRLQQLLAYAEDYTPGVGSSMLDDIFDDESGSLESAPPAQLPATPVSTNTSSVSGDGGGVDEATEKPQTLCDFRSEENLGIARAFIDEAALSSGMDESEDVPGVRLMTMHAAKGLEFEVVFVPGVGCNEGLVPLVRTSVDEPTAELEEETRLFFVSMTRAKRNLRLLHTAWHVTHGYDQRRRNRPSRFLENVLTSGHAMQIDDAKKQRDVFGGKGAGYSTRRSDMDGGGNAPPGTRWQTKVGEKGVSLHSALDGYNNSSSSTDAGRTYMATNSNTRKHAGQRKDDPLDAVSSREGSKSSNQSGMPEKLTPLQQRMRRRLGRRP